ncbi:TetR/AcrR family transcriptional regulator C-terminal domain-containing protein [Prauserella muralis]|uniref:TetR family transcriptional regulator n=1 Tax=Prauserella muralis TaxID=588067 RepID=A0A2V4AM39_9PSEU|nr:TetR/AcrR family transcriptional regulator C-terminal domain-containing protein [Prauserella muralis]PXY21093.1 TetR family transcriptional regulator [Prauserella muralis]TWE30174.1 TetR family transcriptional regulator [Prauserella muralis]
MAVERSGGGHPERTMALLWRAHAEPAGTDRTPRGRKPRLSVDAIVRAAIAVADTEGLPAMSMSRVADELGSGTMSLYTYLPGKAELIDLMVDQVLLECALPGPDEPRTGDWRQQVELYAHRAREVHRRHPWLWQVSLVRPPLGPGVLAVHEYLLSALSGAGLSARQLVDAAGAVATFVDAAARREAESDQAEQVTGESHEAWWAARESYWDRFFDERAHPAMARVRREGGYERAATESNADLFAFGLASLLDGIERGVTRRR